MRFRIFSKCANRLALAALVLALAFAQAPAALAQSIELRMLHHQADTGNRQVLQEMLRGFEAENPGIVVKDFHTKTSTVLPEAQAAAAADRPFDVVLVLARLVPGAIEATNARPFSEAPDGGAFMSAFSEGLRPVGMINGEYYMAPFAFGTPLLFYNMDLMEKAGLDPNSPPATMQELAEMAKKVHENTGENGVYIIAGGLDLGPQTMIRLTGSPYLNGNSAAFNTPDAIEVMQFWSDLVGEGLHPRVPDQESPSIMSAGRLAFLATTSGRTNGLLKGAKGNYRLGVAKFPTWKGRPLKVPHSGAGLMVMSQDAAKKDAAFRLVAFLSQAEITNRWSRETGYMPVSVNPLDDPATGDFIEKVPEYAVVVDQMNDTVPTALWPGNRVVEGQTIVFNLLSDLWEQKGTAAELVPPAAEEVTRILQESTN